MAPCCAPVVFHSQRINALAIPRDCGELAALCGAPLIDRDEAFHAFHSARNVPATTRKCEGGCSTEDCGCYGGKDSNKWAEHKRLGREFALLFLRLSSDLLACCVGFLLLQARDLEGAVAWPLVLRWARLGVLESAWSTHHRAGGLGLGCGTKIAPARGGGRILQGPRRRPAACCG
jgi:hypothetical protein